MSYKNVLKKLHEEAERSDSELRANFNPQMMKDAALDYKKFYHDMRGSYLAIDESFGKFLYMCARMMKAETVVEFGTSFGISTIYLAAALRDNGSGKVVTTEFEPEKIAVAQKNIGDAGLTDFVELRAGDALETLKGFPKPIDMLFLDGAKNLYIPLLKLLEPSFRDGAFIASDNSKMSPDFVTYLHNSSSYVSTDISGRKDNELAIWNGKKS